MSSLLTKWIDGVLIFEIVKLHPYLMPYHLEGWGNFFKKGPSLSLLALQPRYGVGFLNRISYIAKRKVCSRGASLSQLAYHPHSGVGFLDSVPYNVEEAQGSSASGAHACPFQLHSGMWLMSRVSYRAEGAREVL